MEKTGITPAMLRAEAESLGAMAGTPGAIDLEVLKQRLWGQQDGGDVSHLIAARDVAGLIAAVEALRKDNRHQIDRALSAETRLGGLRARVAELCESLNWRNRQVVTWKARAEAAEAHMAALAGALETISLGRRPGKNRDWVCPFCHVQSERTAEIQHTKSCFVPRIRTVLAATPAEVIERAKAVRAEGYAAGLEAAAKCVETMGPGQPTGGGDWDEWSLEDITEAIRALGKEAD